MLEDRREFPVERRVLATHAVHQVQTQPTRAGQQAGAVGSFADQSGAEAGVTEAGDLIAEFVLNVKHLFRNYVKALTGEECTSLSSVAGLRDGGEHKHMPQVVQFEKAQGRALSVSVSVLVVVLDVVHDRLHASEKFAPLLILCLKRAKSLFSRENLGKYVLKLRL